MEPSFIEEKSQKLLDRPINSFLPNFTIYHALVTLIIIAAVISRFYNVGLRVMAHDEVNHVVPSYDLYQGRGYSHDPVTHGPLQFHMVAATYFLLGDSDFSSRVPAALFGVATIVFVLFGFKRYLGKTGALLSGLFFLISPFMLFYSRYTRNESFVALFGVVMLYAVLRYLEQGKHSTLFLYTAVLALQFCTKETSFIYTAQILIFLAVLFIRDVTQKTWKNKVSRDAFILLTMALLLFVGITLGASVLASGSETAVSQPADGTVTAGAAPIFHAVMLISLGLAVISLITAAIVAIKGLGWAEIKRIRSFDLLILTGTLVLPLLTAFPISIAGWNPLDYSEQGMIRTAFFLVGVAIISAALGLVWKPALWLKNTALFYSIFTILYTTFFTNGQGFFTGIVGSLGYWISQQGVNRGSQPWYFFAFLQIPMYEYLPAFGTIVASVIGFKHHLFSTIPGIDAAVQTNKESKVSQLVLPESAEPAAIEEENPKWLPVLALLVYWSVLSLIAYTIAGEKMPWLTVHITLPMLLAAGFGFGYLIDSTPFKQITSRKGLLAILLFPVFLVSLGAVIYTLFGSNPPFAGNTLEQLQVTSTFLFAVIAVVLSGWGIFKLLLDWEFRHIFRLLFITLIGLLAVLTARSAFQASFINYDTAKEFLVYAHSARGPKDVLKQVEEISQRTTGGKDIKVAYIGDALYPYWWYFRDYPNKTWIKDNLTRDLLNYPVIITDDEQLTKTQAIVKDAYIQYKYKRLVWPMQDYFNITPQRFWDGLKNPEMRQAIFNIWLNKDYTLYSQVTGNTGLTLETWSPSGNIYLLIKKDIVASIWNYGTLPATPTMAFTDPYEGKYVTLTPDQFFGAKGIENGQFTDPHGIAIAPDGSIYVADARNHRIQKFDPKGNWLLSWGSYASVDAGSAPGGTFNEPWGIAVAPDGSVYVADTWNYRIQKFTSDGKFLKMWGTPGPGETIDQFWGPRGIVVSKEGSVFVTDTGNNRVIVFDGQGVFITQFGINGVNQGEFDEPVGLAIDSVGNVYIADTWNQRIQVFEPVNDGTGYQFLREWSISGWFGQSVNNKPFLAIDRNDNVFTTDPDGFRVLQFDENGKIIRVWGDSSSGIDGFGSPSGIAADADGNVWVSDAENNYVLHFTIPVTEQQYSQRHPAIPVSSSELTYDQNTESLVNSLGIPVYELNLDGNEWVPIIPDGIASLLPETIQPARTNNGTWILSLADGTTLFTWDPDILVWISPEATITQ